jgi:oligopeptidase A
MNPLLETGDLPAFDRIRPEHIVPAVEQTLTETRTRIDRLLEAQGDYTWDNLLAPLEATLETLHKVWSPVGHLNAVRNSPEIREAYKHCLPLLSAFETELGQHEGLYRAIKAVSESAEYHTLDSAQRKSIEHRLRDFRLSGIALPEAQRKRYKAIQQRLSDLQSSFQDNVLDATAAWKKHITDAAALAGLPDSALALARQAADRQSLDGWLLTLDFPSYFPVITYADNRELREELYTAYTTRASDQGPNAGQWDNSALMEEILALRHEAAQLLGFASYAEYSLETKMAGKPADVLKFLDDLAEHSLSRARTELADVEAFAREQGAGHALEAWDIPYYSERLRQQRYALSQEELKPYFPDTRVVAGLFQVVQRLYGIRIEEHHDVATWHPDVRFFEIRESSGDLSGRFFLDLYARSDKRGGAWMDSYASRLRSHDHTQIPVAYLTCNFSPPLDGQPSLLTHDEVITLFHEFGHGLHHMLTRIDTPSVSGINGVAWDAVELPSQFMENWCWERDALALLSGHYQTGEPLPDELYQRMQAARHFQSAMRMVRQLEFALVDMRLHHEYDPAQGARLYTLLDEVRERVAVLKPPAFNRYLHSFTHVFSGGYAAGYYSYKWAEVLSADAFSLFEENGIFDPASGQRFRNEILAQGGSKEPMDLYLAFRGREPTIDALLRHSGLVPAPAA